MGKDLVTNFVDTLKNKYCCFNGRASQREFWLYILATFIIGIILSIISKFLPSIGGILTLIVNLGLLLPYLGITARRLHDSGKSGWLQLLHLIPGIGSLIVLILCIPAGDAGANIYGEVASK